MDECQIGSFTCHARAVCVNIPGSYSCRCGPGYVGNGKTVCEGKPSCLEGYLFPGFQPLSVKRRGSFWLPIIVKKLHVFSRRHLRTVPTIVNAHTLCASPDTGFPIANAY